MVVQKSAAENCPVFALQYISGTRHPARESCSTRRWPTKNVDVTRTVHLAALSVRMAFHIANNTGAGTRAAAASEQEWDVDATAVVSHDELARMRLAAQPCRELFQQRILKLRLSSAYLDTPCYSSR